MLKHFGYWMRPKQTVLPSADRCTVAVCPWRGLSFEGAWVKGLVCSLSSCQGQHLLCEWELQLYLNVLHVERENNAAICQGGFILYTATLSADTSTSRRHIIHAGCNSKAERTPIECYLQSLTSCPLRLASEYILNITKPI